MHYKGLLRKARLLDICWHDLRSTYCTLLLKQDFNPKDVSKMMGYIKELIRMGVYGNNANIVPKEMTRVISYLDEVMPENSRDDNAESNTLDTVVDRDKF